MDAIGDTDVGLEAYLNAESPDDKHLLYLYAYGTLQLLIVQQDAVRTLAEALDVPLGENTVLKEIRDIRNNAVGHPTKRGRSKGYASNFITRISMTKTSFTLSTMHADKKQSRHGTILIPDLIQDQRKQVQRQLAAIQNSLEEEYEEHFRAFHGKTIRSKIPETIGYHASKIARFDPADDEWPLITANLEVIDDMVAAVRTGLEERGLTDSIPFLELDLEGYDYIAGRLHDYLQCPHESAFQARDMEVFAGHLRTTIQRILDAIDEIDEEYRMQAQSA